MEILALHLQSYIDYARVRNISMNELSAAFPQIGLDNLDINDTVRADEFYEVLGYIDSKLEDEHFGLRTGRFLNLNALGLIYQISLQSVTLAEGIDYLKSFISATLPLISIKDYITDKHTIIDFNIEGTKSELNRIILETVLTIVSKEIIMMSTNDINMQVTTPHFEDTYPACFQYGNKYSIRLSDVQLKASIRKHAEKHLDYLIPQYIKMLEGLKKSESFTNKVKMVALSMAKPALPGLGEIADTFNLTPRTLQRTLAKENLTYRQITEDLNKQLSLLLLRHQKYTVKDVGYLLGYSEPAAFNHCFKKWYGSNPASMRMQK